MSKKKNNPALMWGGIAIVVIVVLILLIVLFTSSGPDYTQESVDAFAKCITDSGATMYGAFWCPHCAKTKKMFGNSFQYIDYVECDPRGDNQQAELCLEKDILDYDTWEFADGSRIVSEPTFEELSQKTGCAMPQEAE